MPAALSSRLQHLETDADCAVFRARLVCEEPNEHFGVFNGTLYLDPRLQRPPPQDPPELQDLKAPLPEPASPSALDKPTTAGAPSGSAAAADVRVVLDANNMLLRGCVLRNVEYIYGLVVYTGNEAKVRVKQQAKTTKKPAIERKINVYIVYLVGFLLALCVGSSLGYYFYSVAEADHAWYLVLDPPSGADTTERFFTFLLVISNIVPLSLYVSMKLTRTAQKLFMDFDLECVYVNEEELKRSGGESGRYPLSVRVMDLNDELGQITHLFTDKTGTLTSNYMEFRKMSINGEACRGSEAGWQGLRRDFWVQQRAGILAAHSHPPRFSPLVQALRTASARRRLASRGGGATGRTSPSCRLSWTGSTSPGSASRTSTSSTAARTNRGACS